MKKIIFILILIIVSNGCSNSDLDDNNSNKFVPKDLTLIAKDNNQYYQIDVLNNSENINTTNLTETMGIEGSYRVLNTSPSLITFFKAVGNGFSVFQKNIITSESYVLNQYCDLDTPEGIILPAISDKKLIQFTSEPNESNGYVFNIFIRVYDKKIENCVKLLIGPGLIDSHWLPMVNDENLYLYYINEDNKYVIVKINLNTIRIEEELVFETNFRATLRDKELHIFFFDGNYEIYNTVNFELIRKSTYNVGIINESPGLFTTKFIDNEMLFRLSYAQPSPVVYGPATINLTTGEVTKGLENNLLDVRRDLESHLIEHIGITTYSVDLRNNLIVVGFEIIEQNNNSGGVVYTNFEGEILKIVELDIAPYKIIIR